MPLQTVFIEIPLKMLKIFELAPWILTILAVAKNMVSPAFLIMPLAVKEGGTVITIIVTVLVFLVVLHGTLISSALKNYIGASKGKSVETMLLSDACEKMGARGPEFLRSGGLHLANMIRLSEFLVHIFRCSFYISVIVDILETMTIFENYPNALLVLIITLTAVALSPISQIWQLRMIFGALGSTLVAFVLAFVVMEAAREDVDEELVDKRGDPQYVPFCIGKVLFLMTFFSPHLNSDFRQPSLSYIPPYVVGLVVHTVLALSLGTFFYRAYTEETATLIFFNLKSE